MFTANVNTQTSIVGSIQTPIIVSAVKTSDTQLQQALNNNPNSLLG